MFGLNKLIRSASVVQQIVKANKNVLFGMQGLRNDLSDEAKINLIKGIISARDAINLAEKILLDAMINRFNVSNDFLDPNTGKTKKITWDQAIADTKSVIRLGEDLADEIIETLDKEKYHSVLMYYYKK